MKLQNKLPTLIKGGLHEDERGQLKFINDFDMSAVRRMYISTPSADKPWRAWQGHKLEQKWFLCTKGSFEVYLIEPDNWDAPDRNAKALRFSLEAARPETLWIPGGYINGFKSLSPGSSIFIFSSATLEESQKDDFRFDKDYWNVD